MCLPDGIYLGLCGSSSAGATLISTHFSSHAGVCDNSPPIRPLEGCPSLTSEYISSSLSPPPSSPLLASPVPLPLGAILESLTQLQQPAGLRLEPGLGTGGASPHRGSALRILHVHFHLLEEEGHSNTMAFPLTPVPTKACQPVQVNAFLTVLSLSFCGQWARAE